MPNPTQNVLGCFITGLERGNPKALVQLYGIYIDEIAVEYTHETEFAMSSLRGEVGARLFINRDPMKPLQRDGRISVSSSLLDQLR